MSILQIIDILEMIMKLLRIMKLFKLAAAKKCAASIGTSGTLTARTGNNDVYANLSSRVGNVAADGAQLALLACILQ